MYKWTYCKVLQICQFFYLQSQFGIWSLVSVMSGSLHTVIIDCAIFHDGSRYLNGRIQCAAINVVKSHNEEKAEDPCLYRLRRWSDMKCPTRTIKCSYNPINSSQTTGYTARMFIFDLQKIFPSLSNFVHIISIFFFVPSNSVSCSLT